LIRRETSLGGVDTTLEHRASVEPPNYGTPENLLRVSTGIENIDDLREDFEQALKAV
jgi:cystathionine gamma-synthase